MYIDTVPNRNSPPAVLLRESSRVGNKIIKRTLANLSEWPAPQVDLLRRVLKGEALLSPSQALHIERSLPHGHVAAALGTLRRIGLESDLSRSACPERDLVCAMIVARILCPASKLATARGLHQQTASSSLGALLGLELVDEDYLYAAMDWLLPRQARLEDKLAARHLQPATAVLYDVTSTYFEGRRCPLAQYGHSWDERPGNLQIVFGLLTNPEGCPVAVEVFEGNTADPKTVAGQIRKLRQRFELQQVVLVGDRGMLTSARISRRPAERRRRALDHRVEGAADPAVGHGWELAVIAIRPARPGGDSASGVSGRTVDCLPQSVVGRRAETQTRRVAHGYRETVGKDSRRYATQTSAAAWQKRDRSGGGQGAGPLQNGEALAVDHRRGSLRLAAQTGKHRAGSGSGWDLCDSHQRTRQ